MGYLRRIAVYVDEPEPGDFFWVLLENNEDSKVWGDLETSTEPYKTWMEAFDAGNARVMFLAENLDTGPRRR